MPIEPLLSIIIPCFNPGKLLHETFESISSQTGAFRIKEIIIVDDRSDDPDTLAILDQLRLDPRVKMLKNKGPKGPSAARNTGIAVATGEWIKFHDADDLLTPGALNALFSASKQYPEAGWIGGDYIVQNDFDNTSTGPMLAQAPLAIPEIRASYTTDTPVLLRKPTEAFLKTSLTNTVSNIIKKSLIVKLSGFDETLKYQQDYHFFLRLTRESDFVFVPKAIMIYRHHANNHTRNGSQLFLHRLKVLELLSGDSNFIEFKKPLRRKMVETLITASGVLRRDKHPLAALICSAKGSFFKPLDFFLWKESLKNMLTLCSVPFGKR